MKLLVSNCHLLRPDMLHISNSTYKTCDYSHDRGGISVQTTARGPKLLSIFSVPEQGLAFGSLTNVLCVRATLTVQAGAVLPHVCANTKPKPDIGLLYSI